MTNNINVSLKTLAIKARVYNFIRQSLYKKRLAEFSDKQKIEFFDQIFALNHVAHWELNDYKNKRKFKARINKLREERQAQKLQNAVNS